MTSFLHPSSAESLAHLSVVIRHTGLGVQNLFHLSCRRCNQNASTYHSSLRSRQGPVKCEPLSPSGRFRCTRSNDPKSSYIGQRSDDRLLSDIWNAASNKVV